MLPTGCWLEADFFLNVEYMSQLNSVPQCFDSFIKLLHENVDFVLY